MINYKNGKLLSNRVKQESVQKKHGKKSHIWAIFYEVNESSNRQRIIKRAFAEKVTSEKTFVDNSFSHEQMPRGKINKWPKHKVAK